MIEKNSGKPYMNVIFGNFYSPGYDDPDFVDETMEPGPMVVEAKMKPGPRAARKYFKPLF